MDRLSRRPGPDREPARSADPRVVRAAPAPDIQLLLDLQRDAGNAAATRLMRRGRWEPKAATRPMVVQRAVVYDRSGQAAEYADSEILYDADAGRWETPRGDLLKRNADGSYSPIDATPAATASGATSSGTGTTSAPRTAGNQSPPPAPMVVSPDSYKKGYEAGRAGNDSNPGPMDPADLLVYKQGYADGTKEADRTKTSAGPSTSGGQDRSDRPPAETGPGALDGVLAWKPTRTVVVYDASGAATDVPEDQLTFEAPTGQYIGPKGERLVLNEDGSYAPAPGTSSASPKEFRVAGSRPQGEP